MCFRLVQLTWGERETHIYQILPIEHLNSVKAIILSFVEHCCLPTPERRRWLFECKHDDDDDGDSTLEKTNLSSEDNQLPEMVRRRRKTKSVYSIVSPFSTESRGQVDLSFPLQIHLSSFQANEHCFLVDERERCSLAVDRLFLLSQLASGRVPRPPIYHSPHLISDERQWH